MVVALVTDLLFSSKIRSEALSKNKPLRICRSSKDLSEALDGTTPDCVIIDLNSRNTAGLQGLKICKERGIIEKVVAFCSHVDKELQQHAETEGVKKVLARSQFVKEISKLV